MRKLILNIAAALSLMTAAETVFALNEAELKICEALIEDLRTRTDLSFIRNGSEHSAAEAADHIQRKLDYAKDDLSSVDDFIEHLASSSSLSGRDYLVVDSNGHEITAREYWRARLKSLNLTSAD